MANGGVALSYGGKGEAGKGGVEEGPAPAAPSEDSGRERNPRDGRRVITLSRFGALASSAAAKSSA